MNFDFNFFRKSKDLPLDKFLNYILYDKKYGYYSKKYPFGNKGDFITAPFISKIFSEIISIWMISTWELFGKPDSFNIVELGPGDGSFIKVFLEVSKKFPQFNSSKQIFLYEKSKSLQLLQKKNIRNNEIKWIKDFKNIKKGPIIFFGNEFFDAIPIKQFKKENNKLLEKYLTFKKDNKISTVFKYAKNQDIDYINSYKTLKSLKFIEFPKLGLQELNAIINAVKKLNGCILLIDYGYIKSNNQNTIQSVFKNKKSYFLNNLGKSDISSHINFSLLKEHFLNNNLKVKKIITQKDFLSNMGIIERAEIIAKKMSFREQTNLYLRLRRLMSPKLMGKLFKVILAFKHKKNKYFGFD